MGAIGKGEGNGYVGGKLALQQTTLRHESFSGIFSFVQLFVFQLTYICRENQTWLSVDREGK
jgi:hypothetical protein